MSFRSDRLGYIAMVLACSGMLTACGSNETQDLHQFVKQVRAKQHTRIEPLPEFKPYETFLYQASNLRSPFVPSAGASPEDVLAEPRDNGIHPDANRPKEALEAFPLDTLRMVGTLEQNDQSWGLVQTDDGTIHRIQPGNYLGQNHGKIVSISENEIDLVEIVPDGLGGWVERQASLALSE